MEDITAGHLLLDGKDITQTPAKDRDMAMVFQNYALYGHMTIYENMAFSLTLRKENPNVIHKKVLAAAEILGLTTQLNKKPSQLSGGQRQRVAMGRSIVRNPKVFLFDEPLSNLDAKLRGATRREILLLHKRLKATIYYAPEAYRVYLNGEQVREGDSNVFSLFGLTPETDYALRVEGASVREECAFRTNGETCALNIRDFGAAGDGRTDDTDAIQFAVSSLPPDGRLYFPPGRYLSRPLSLKSRITIELAEGAVLLGCPDRERYPVVPGVVRDMDGGPEVHFGGFEGEARPMYQSLLTAQYARDIKIVGLGTVDGNGRNSDFWTKYREFPTARPRLLFFNRCENVTLHGVHICDSPSWQVHPYYSKNVGMYDLRFSAPKDSPNTDAIDPESCDGVDIIGCRFAVGDDCIAIKSGKIALGSTLNTPADRHTIRNCLMEFGHGAAVLGSEIGAGVRNLNVSRCFFRGTDRGLRIKSRRGRGKNCVIDGVAFENIRMEGVLTPIAINLWYNCCDPDRESEYVWSREKLPADDRTPRMGRFLFRGLDCVGAEVAACYADGLPEAPIEEVTLENIRVRFSPDAKPGVPIMENFAKKRCRLGLYLNNVRRVRVRNVTIEGAEGDGLIVNHYEELETDGLTEKPL